MKMFPLIVAVLVALAGCESTLTGEEGNLLFSYTTVTDVTNFNKAIAVGALLDVRVRDAERREATDIQSASTDDESVLSVASFSGDHVSLRGEGAGNTRLTVRAETTSGGVLSDSVSMRASVADAMDINHVCEPFQGGRVYLAESSDVLFSYRLRAGNQDLIGYGFLPVASVPDNNPQPRTYESSQLYFQVDMPAEATTFSLVPEPGGEALEVSVLAPGDVDGFELVDEAAEHENTAGHTFFRGFWLLADGARICQPRTDTIEVMSETPDVCRASTSDIGVGLLGMTAWMEIEGLSAGVCSVVASFPQGSDGNGVGQIFEFEILE